MKHRPINATILTHNLSHNLKVVKKLTNLLPTWAVVKANAYGHGLESAVKAFSESEGIALLDIEDAALVRKLGWTGKILLLEGVFSELDFIDVIDLSCDFVIHQEEQITWLIQFLQSKSSSEIKNFAKSCSIWLKLNSGMNRLGFKSAQYGVSYEILKSLGFEVNHMTHFANADDMTTKPNVESQWEIFTKATQIMEGSMSAANSAAIIQHSFTHADITRPGIMLYGASPSGLYKDIEHLGLKAGMNLRTKIIAIQEINSGESIGYGSQFTAKANTKVAVIACGYADGYPRHAPNGTPVWVGKQEDITDGQIVPIIGRVSMDMITIDITNLHHAKVGSPVELWGENLPIDNVAQKAQTVGYELMCAIAPRVERQIL